MNSPIAQLHGTDKLAGAVDRVEDTTARHDHSTQPYAASFSVMRERFRRAAQRAGAELSEYLHPLHGPDGEVLATDVALLGRRDASKLIVLISGTHGVEGAFGSACQTAWLSQKSPWKLDAKTAVLAIHLINPWGTAWSRRVNEDNVDLNRNFIDWSAGTPENNAYAGLHSILTCREWEGPDRVAADEKLLATRKRLGQAGLAAIVEAGQYEFPDGLFYGGARPVWSNRTLTDILSTFAAAARHAIVFDLHTGAGPYAYPALLSVASSEHPGMAWGKSVFGPALATVITGSNATTSTGIAATATGYVSEAVVRAMPDARVLPLVVECGTLDGAAVMDAVQADNWLHLFGRIDSAIGKRIKATLRGAFIPDDADWQRTCLSTSLRYFDRALSELRTVEVVTSEPDLNAPTVPPARIASVDHTPAATARVATPAVQIEDLHKSFGSLLVLKGVNLTAHAGEVISMIGSSGSGKSTFLRCINLLEQPDGGKVAIDGELIKMKQTSNGRAGPADMAQVERIRARVGMVFQSFNLWPHMTVLENIIEAPRHVLKEPREKAVDHAHALLKKVGLSDKHAHYPGQLSGGQQQRAAIARTLAMRPKVILFDEPTSALDPELVGEVLRVIRQLAEEGNTMILVTHEMQFAREVSHKILFLHQGKVEEEGAPAELFGSPRSERLRQFLARTL
ncbi:ABC transporter [Mesorhizobium loti]|nr:ABC transporter [Mesorhizobium loti]